MKDLNFFHRSFEYDFDFSCCWEQKGAQWPALVGLFIHFTPMICTDCSHWMTLAFDGAFRTMGDNHSKIAIIQKIISEWSWIGLIYCPFFVNPTFSWMMVAELLNDNRPSFNLNDVIGQNFSQCTSNSNWYLSKMLLAHREACWADFIIIATDLGVWLMADGWWLMCPVLN